MQVALKQYRIVANQRSKKYSLTAALKMVNCIFRDDAMESNTSFFKTKFNQRLQRNQLQGSPSDGHNNN